MFFKAPHIQPLLISLTYHLLFHSLFTLIPQGLLLSLSLSDTLVSLCFGTDFFRFLKYFPFTCEHGFLLPSFKNFLKQPLFREASLDYPIYITIFPIPFPLLQYWLDYIDLFFLCLFSQVGCLRSSEFCLFYKLCAPTSQNIIWHMVGK